MSKKAQRVKTPTPVSSSVVDEMEARVADAPPAAAVAPAPSHDHSAAHDDSVSHDSAPEASSDSASGSETH